MEGKGPAHLEILWVAREHPSFVTLAFPRCCLCLLLQPRFVLWSRRPAHCAFTRPVFIAACVCCLPHSVRARNKNVPAFLWIACLWFSSLAVPSLALVEPLRASASPTLTPHPTHTHPYTLPFLKPKAQHDHRRRSHGGRE